MQLLYLNDQSMQQLYLTGAKYAATLSQRTKVCSYRISPDQSMQLLYLTGVKYAKYAKMLLFVFKEGIGKENQANVETSNI